MLDQLQIGNLYSYDDFEASVAKRKISNPKKKSIKETVPFSNLTYDFSAINGEVYYEERDLEYIFEITADTPEMLEELKMKFSSWVMNVMNEKLYDPFIEDYHFLATYDDMSCDDEESMDKSTITVKFKAYPYKIANNTKKIVIPLYAYEDATAKIENNSSHRITPTFNSDIPFVLEVNGNSYGVPSGEVNDESFKIESGVTEITVKNNEVISEKKSGNNIVFENSASARFKNIVVYGKSWQNGTPTPTEPQPIESLENVEVKVLGTEEQTLTIPYVLRNGDKVEYASGKRLQDTTIINLSDLEWNKGNTNTKGDGMTFYTKRYDFHSYDCLCTHLREEKPLDGVWENQHLNTIMNSNYIVVCTSHSTLEEFTSWLATENVQILTKLDEPIVAELTEAEIQAYKALKANEPTTRIISDAELEVECAVKPETPVQVGTLNISFVEEVF